MPVFLYGESPPQGGAEFWGFHGKAHPSPHARASAKLFFLDSPSLAGRGAPAIFAILSGFWLANYPLSPLDSSPGRRSKTSGWPRNAYSGALACPIPGKASLLRFPLPSGEGEGGGAPILPANPNAALFLTTTLFSTDIPLSSSDSSSSKGEQMFDSAKAVACGVAAGPLRRLLHGVPSPLW